MTLKKEDEIEHQLQRRASGPACQQPAPGPEEVSKQRASKEK